MERTEIEKLALDYLSQDSWVRLGLMHLSPRMPLIVNPTGRKDDWGVLVANRLEADAGYVVLEEELAAVLPARVGRDRVDVLREVIKSLRRPGRLNQPILTAIDIGYAVSVAGLDLTVEEAVTLHVFRHNEGLRMPSRYISREIFGFTDSFTEATIRKNVYSLRNKPAHGETFEIVTRGRWDGKGYVYNELTRKRRR